MLCIAFTFFLCLAAFGRKICIMLEYLRQLNFASMTLRIILAVVIGGLIGLERERKGRGAGFRTYMLVALGSSLTIMLSQYLDIMLNGPWKSTADIIGIKTDISRFGAQVINGVGFLGAGTIIVTKKKEVKGLTTAAGLWTSACMGLAIGAGFYECVLVSFFFVFIIMIVFPMIENAFLIRSKYMNVSIDLDSMDKLSGLISKIKEENIQIFNIDVDKDNIGDCSRNVNVIINLNLNDKVRHEQVVAELSTIDGVIAIDEI